jgi:hypothetical protein
MTITPWLLDGKVVVNADGQPIICAACPCNPCHLCCEPDTSPPLVHVSVKTRFWCIDGDGVIFCDETITTLFDLPKVTSGAYLDYWGFPCAYGTLNWDNLYDPDTDIDFCDPGSIGGGGLPAGPYSGWTAFYNLVAFCRYPTTGPPWCLLTDNPGFFNYLGFCLPSGARCPLLYLAGDLSGVYGMVSGVYSPFFEVFTDLGPPSDISECFRDPDTLEWDAVPFCGGVDLNAANCAEVRMQVLEVKLWE